MLRVLDKAEPPAELRSTTAQPDAYTQKTEHESNLSADPRDRKRTKYGIDKVF